MPFLLFAYPLQGGQEKRQTMKLRSDENADALYMRLDDSRIVESE
jgi:hypothetical protein